ncbi:DPH3 homolog isoform X1 [Mauremys reevesii]|uniref:DPH3 homolog isoform X1 n=1 Tax=Mauremys reevesii TaxID=260615 RepID=UPI00193F0259|nr:DPH3 homolog isoform X1 [Mauremys reevesii]
MACRKTDFGARAMRFQLGRRLAHTEESARKWAGGVLDEDLENGEDVATCPSCSLIVRVIYDQEQFMCGEVVSAPTSKELVKC